MAELAEQELFFIVIATSAGMLLLVITIGVFTIVYQKRMYNSRIRLLREKEVHERNMIESQLKSQEQERRRIAAELHDSVGSLLWGAKLNANYLQRYHGYEDEQRQSYDELMSALNKAIESVRNISWELTPQAFHQSGFSGAVSKMCGRLNVAPFAVEFVDETHVFWNDDRALSMFRIVQELVANAVKHSNGSEIHVKLKQIGNTLAISVMDNGTGFVLKDQRTGVGWWNIRQRADQLQAVIDIGHPPSGRGASISVSVPFEL